MSKIRKQKNSEAIRKRYHKRIQKKKANNVSAALEGLKKEFSKYNQKDLISTLGGLQLLPENHSHLVRFEFASRIACLSLNSGNKKVDLTYLVSILNQYLPIDGPIGRMEDPVENLFTENIVFYGGNYLVYPGLDEGGTFTLHGFLDAIYKYGDNLTNEYKRLVNPTAIALLSISNLIANRLGHHRYMESPDAWRKPIVSYKGKDFYKYKDVVHFAFDELEQYFNEMGIDYRFLTPFIINVGDPKLNNDNPHENPLFFKPLVRSNNEIYLIQPGSIVTALKHFIIVTAKHTNLENEFFTNLTNVAKDRVSNCLNLMNFTPEMIDLPPLKDMSNVGELIYRIDSDKLAYALSIIDDGKDYDNEKPLDSWNNQDISKNIDLRICQIADYLISQNKFRCSELFIIITFLGIGRTFYFGLSERPDNTRMLLTSIYDLEIITHLRECDNLSLWKYSCAYDELTEKNMLPLGSTSFLDSYSLYLDNHHSFNLSDQEQVIPFVGVGYGHKLRVKSALTSDYHAAKIMGKDGKLYFINVIRRYEGDPIPIYMSDAFSGYFGRLIEGYSQPIWVMKDFNDEDIIEGLNEIYSKITDMLSYWLWQITPSLREHLNCLKNSPIYFQFKLESPSEWLNIPSIEQADPKVQIIYKIENGNIYFTIPNIIQPYLARVNNEGERIIVDYLLMAVNAYLKYYGYPESLTENERKFILDKHVPLGKKKMILMTSQNNTSLNIHNLPRLHKLQEHDLEEQLNNLVLELKNVALPKGEIVDKNEKKQLLNDLVDIFYMRLKTYLRHLAWRPLLEKLIENNEAIWNKREISNLTTPTLLACFTNIESKINRDMEEYSIIDSTALANRTLIEIIAAEPPRGEKSVSSSDFDKLLAITHHIVNWSMLSDRLHFRISDVQLSILGSGRIGVIKKELDEFRDKYLKAKIAEGIDRANSRFTKYFEVNKPNDKNEDYSDIEKAFEAEFKLTMSQIVEFHRSLTHIGFRQHKACCFMHLSELNNCVKETLDWKKAVNIGWTDEKSAVAFELFSLKQRCKWEEAPDGFKKEDIYPWKYNRRLSYLRRCLVMMPDREDDPLVFWGPRHAEESCRQLIVLINDGRYKLHQDSSTEMKELLGKIHEIEGKQFNRIAKKWFEDNTNWEIHLEVSINPNTILKAGEDLGDIDIFAIDRHDSMIFSIECKNVNSGRNPQEMANELERFLTGDKSWVEKHLKRDKWLKQNKKMINQIYSLGNQNYKIFSFILTYEEVPTGFLRNVPLLMLSFYRLKREGISIILNNLS